MRHLHILYRGPLSSCNYRCSYCPFGKRKDTKETLERDAANLARFTGWIEAQKGRSHSILFAPWGEALIRSHYREAMVRLSRMPAVRAVAIQTNLSCAAGWMGACDPAKAAFWCTFHPGETELAPFLEKCASMSGMGIRFSVGAVGWREHFQAIAALREALPREVYVWVNAAGGRKAGYYSAEEIDFLAGIDPLFEISLAGVRSLGRRCLAGESEIAVDGSGEARRCFFAGPPIGNIYAPGFEEVLKAGPCPNRACVCHIGYSFMPELGFEELFGPELAHRIPRRELTREDARRRLG